MTISSYKGIALTAALVLAIPALALGAEIIASEQPSLASSVRVNDDLYMVGGNVTSAGTVVGDLIAGGGSVLVSGDVSGDIAAVGGNVTLLGGVGDDVRAGGGNIVVNGNVRGDLVVGGGQVQITAATVGGDALIGAGTLRIDSAIGGNVKIGGGDIYLNGPIAGDVEIKAEKLTLGPNANISGNLTYTAAKAATIEDGAIVQGETSFSERKISKREGAAVLAGIITAALIGKLLMSLVGAFALFLLFRKFAHALVEKATEASLYEMGRGLVVLIVAPVVSVLLLVTIIGIPLGVLGLLGFAAALVFVSLAAPIVLGSITHKLVMRRSAYEVSWKTVLLGVALYFIVGLIPVVGWVLKFALVLLTLGAMVNIKWGALKAWR